MSEDWFDALSIKVRVQFLYRLLIGCLASDIEQQKKVMKSETFLALPAYEQAWLLRMVATDHIMRNTTGEFVVNYLEQAKKMQPTNKNTRLLLTLWAINPAVCRQAVLLWHKLRQPFDLTKERPASLLVNG